MKIVNSFHKKNTHKLFTSVKKYLKTNVFTVFDFQNKIFLKNKIEKIVLLTSIVTAMATLSLAFFGWQQIEETNRLKEIQYTADWGNLRNTMWDVMDLYPPRGVKDLQHLTNEEKIIWTRQVRKLLDSEIKNPVLIQDRSMLGYWRNAISTTRALETELMMQLNFKNEDKHDLSTKRAESILNDISKVWVKLILDSDEVSPTGGHPEE